MAHYTGFIKENVAPKGAKRIGIYNTAGNRVGQIPLGNLALKNTGGKLYSFGVISDPEIAGASSVQYPILTKALQFFADNDDISFICVCGDLTSYLKLDSYANEKEYINAKRSELEAFADAVNTYAGGKSVYSIAGNHELTGEFYKELHETLDFGAVMENGTQVPEAVRVIEPNDSGDVFVMLSTRDYNPSGGGGGFPECQQYSVKELKQIDDVFYANKDKRCFVFHHIPPLADHTDKDGQISGGFYLPLSFWRHYKNITLFHGHSHHAFSRQIKDLDGGATKQTDDANYGETFGFRSVHIPTLMHTVGQCYIVDVYQNGIHLQGYDFKTDDFIPYASYWVDTRLVDMGETGNYWTDDKFV